MCALEMGILFYFIISDELTLSLVFFHVCGEQNISELVRPY
jgi:hypothetical protein